MKNFAEFDLRTRPQIVLASSEKTDTNSLTLTFYTDESKQSYYSLSGLENRVQIPYSGFSVTVADSIFIGTGSQTIDLYTVSSSGNQEAHVSLVKAPSSARNLGIMQTGPYALAMTERNDNYGYLPLAGGTMTGPILGESDARISMPTHGGSYINSKNTSKSVLEISTPAVTGTTRYDSIIGGKFTDDSVYTLGVIDKKFYFGYFTASATSNAFTNSGYFDFTTGRFSDATRLAGMVPSKLAGANTIAQRDSNGYLTAGYFKDGSAVDDANAKASSMITYQNSNGYFRHMSRGRAKAYILRLDPDAVSSAAENIGFTTGNYGVCCGQLIAYNSGATGYVRMAASAFAVVSCKHLKTNVKDISEIEARKVLNLRPVSFDYKDPYGKKNQYGLIAEETYDVMPKLVEKGENWKIHDDETNKKQIEEHFSDVSGDIPTVNYTQIIPHLIKLAQSFDERLSKLEALKED